MVSSLSRIGEYDRQGIAEAARLDIGALHVRLRELPASHDALEGRRQALLDLLAELTNATGAVWLGENDSGELAAIAESLSARARELQPQLTEDFHYAASEAIAGDRAYVGRASSAASATLTILAAPAADANGNRGSVCLLLALASQRVEPFVALLQLVPGYLHSPRDNEREARHGLELCSAVQRSGNLSEAGVLVARTLAVQLGCTEVMVGFRRRSRRCRLEAVSSTPSFDRRSNLTRDVELLMDECVSEGIALSASLASEYDDHPSSAPLARLCDGLGAARAVVLPIPRGDGEAAGAVLCLWNGGSTSVFATIDRAQRLTALAGAAIDARRRGFAGPLRRTLRKIFREGHSLRRVAAVALPLLVIASLLIPVEHVLKAVTTLQPTSLRFVSAPFNAVLLASHATPGEIVTGGALLATLDGRELEWELTTLVADRDKSSRQYAARLAAGDTPGAQLAKLEVERLGAQVALVEDRLGNLRITAPHDGVVVQGDLEREIGRPLDKGQRLFEIAPLRNMVAEVAVPAEDVSYLTEGMVAEVGLESFPDRVWRETVSRVWPRSEIREASNVFVAEVVLNNSEKILRPGMRGRARLIVGDRSLGWVLFHRPWERFVGWLRW